MLFGVLQGGGVGVVNLAAAAEEGTVMDVESGNALFVSLDNWNAHVDLLSRCWFCR
jgi:hypothetical protein